MFLQSWGRGSNPEPFAYKASALPIELTQLVRLPISVTLTTLVSTVPVVLVLVGWQKHIAIAAYQPEVVELVVARVSVDVIHDQRDLDL